MKIYISIQIYIYKQIYTYMRGVWRHTYRLGLNKANEIDGK